VSDMVLVAMNRAEALALQRGTEDSPAWLEADIKIRAALAADPSVLEEQIATLLDELDGLDFVIVARAVLRAITGEEE